MNAVRGPAAIMLALIAACAAAQPAPVTPYTETTLRQILSLGPWPPAPRTDPSNRVSGNAAAIAFGAALFSDRRLSGNGAIACADCHRPDRSHADGLPQARGLASGERNTPSLANVGGQRWYGWDGANDNLWAQSLRPLLDGSEMGSSVVQLASAIHAHDDLRARYVAVFERLPSDDDTTVAVDIAKALAAYQETLVTPRTPFDDYRDALARGDATAAARYPAAARRGLATFVGPGNCIACHSGPRFSNGEFHDVGVAFFVAPGRVDPGRHGGIKRLLASPYNLLGAYSDDPARSTAISTRHVAVAHRNFGEFKVPSLRNVARTAPYMHDGSLKTLRDVVRHYANIDLDRLHADGEQILKPLPLDKYDVDDLVAFLETLSEPPPPASPVASPAP